MNKVQKWLVSKGLVKRSQEPGNEVGPVNLSGANNMFGSIASGRWPISTGMDFIPLNAQGKTLDLTGTDVAPQWIGLSTKQMQDWAYEFCSPLGGVIDRLAEADTNGIIKFLDENGIVRTNIPKIPTLSRIKKLFADPNPLQTWYEFNAEQVIHCKKFGYCPVFAITPVGFDKSYTKFLINLNPMFVTPRPNLDFDLFSDDPKKHNPISSWTLSIFNQRYEIPAEDILLIKDGLINNTNLSNLGLPLSKVQGLDYFVSNICAAMEADNVLLKKKGPLGVFSHDPKPDIAGWTPMDPDDKDDLQGELKRYGLTWGQLQYVISKTPIKWNAMSFNLRDLMTKETVRQGIDGICDRFGYPAELMSGKNATYENRNSAEKFLYQNNIIPFSLRRMARYNSFFGISGLILDYDHLPVLQEDIMKAGQARLANSQSLQIDWMCGMITQNEYRTGLGMDEIPGGEIYYDQWIKAHPEMQPQKQKTTKPKDAPTA